MVTRPLAHATVEMLREVKLFACFNEPELTQLLKLGELQSFESWANVVIEGEPSWGVYLILDGIVGISKNSQVADTVYDIGQLRAGSFFGEMSLVDENPRSATVRALTECHVFFLSKDKFMAFLGNNSDRKVRFYEACTRQMVQRLRELNDNYVVSQYQLWKTAIDKDKDKDREAA